MLGEASPGYVELSTREALAERHEREKRPERRTAKVERLVSDHEGQLGRGKGRSERSAERDEPSKVARCAERAGELVELERDVLEPLRFVEEPGERAGRQSRGPGRDGAAPESELDEGRKVLRAELRHELVRRFEKGPGTRFRPG